MSMLRVCIRFSNVQKPSLQYVERLETVFSVLNKPKNHFRESWQPQIKTLKYEYNTEFCLYPYLQINECVNLQSYRASETEPEFAKVRARAGTRISLRLKPRPESGKGLSQSMNRSWQNIYFNLKQAQKWIPRLVS